VPAVEVRVRVATILLSKAVPPLDASRFDLSIQDGSTVEELIEKLGLPPRLVGSVTVNNRRSKRDRFLKDGDKVGIVPSVAGG